MEADFSGYATKAGLKCSDGRTIMIDAFKHQDGAKVPLVWQHGHNEPANILGHALLENRPDGVYAYAFFNDTDSAKSAKTLVQHGDITALSIYANKLVERSKQVLHGAIREVSLVLSGANPGALIDNVTMAHADGDVETLEDEAIIYTGLALEHEDMSDDSSKDDAAEHSADSTVQDIYDSLTDEQKQVVHFMIGAAIESNAATHSDDSNEKSDDKTSDDTSEDNLNHQEGTDMTRNVFEQNKDKADEGHILSHDDVKGIMANAVKGGSLKAAVEDYALEHGITNIATLFPDAKNIQDRPEWITRRNEWVAGVINGAKHSPFSRIKTRTADLTFDSARAKGYIKGTLKKEQFFSIAFRVTTPQTIYKKQKLDRDDVIDITDFDIIAWLKMEMRFMLEEELARAILIGDGRDVADADKILEANIRPIAKDDELYVTTVLVNIDDTNSSYNEIVEEVLLARRFYKGTGSPVFYTTEEYLTRMLLAKDGQQRRLYNNVGELASAMRVSDIVAVEAMENEVDLVGICVNMVDYTIGADRGGEINFFDDFDIDYNQYKHLIETRVSGALTKVKAALVIRKTAATNVLVRPAAPTFVNSSGVVTIVAQTGVVYKNKNTNAVLTAGAQTALAVGATLVVLAVPASGYYFATNAADEWTFTRP